MIDSVFTQISVLFGLTVSIAFVMRLLRQPLLVGYLIAGIVAGPFFLNLFHGDTELFHALSEFGVILLLFVVGLSLNFDHIKKIGKVSLLAGLSQVIFTSTLGFSILYFFMDFSFMSALYLAIAITFSSTIIITKLLNDKKANESVYGRYTIGLMIVQDIVALFIIIVLTSFQEDLGLQNILNVLLWKIVLLTALVYFLARYVVPRILDSVAKSTEFLFIFTVAWCFGVASLLLWLGFSAEVGALIAGLTLGSSTYQTEISSRIKPLRDFFIVMFFIILGSQLSIANLSVVLIPGIILSLFILLGNPFILYWVFRLLKFTRKNSFLSGVTAAQVSEFGFVLLLTGEKLGHIGGGAEMEVFTLVALITIISSSYLITYNEKVYYSLLPVFRLFGRDKYRQKEEKAEAFDVWVFGYHRIGWKICQSLQEEKVSFAVVDFNPAAIEKLKARGIAAYFGDASDVEFLDQLPLHRAKMVISTLPDLDDQKTLIKHIRSKSKKPIIISNLYHIDGLEELYDAGANHVMLPHLVAGNWLSTLLKKSSWTKKTFNKLHKEQKEELTLRFSEGIEKA